ncbi:MAG: tetratricopeptide repeat protein [Bacteroidota bacterium]|nr:tetratricopeptide repeat protein [Bacteroidota bacterium]
MQRAVPFFMLILLPVLLLPLQAQQQGETARLETLLRSREARGLRDSVTVRLLLDLAQEYRKTDPEQSIVISQRAEELARSVDDNPGLANAFASSGISYAQQGSWVRALNFFLKALKLKEELDDRQGMAALLSNIGIVHGRLDDEERALRYHLRAVRYFQMAGDKRGLAYSYNNIGVIYMDQGKYDDALRSFQSSLEIKKELRDRPGIASTYLNIGITHYLLGKYSRALENYEYSAKLYESLGDRHGLAEAMQRIATLHLRRRDAQRAFAIASRALEITRATNSRVVERNLLKLCAEAKSALGDPSTALQYYQQYTALKDSLFNEESSKRISEITANYEFMQRERSDRENELLRKEQRIREMELEKRARTLHEQRQNIELLNRNRRISELQLKEQEASIRAQQLETAERDNEIRLLNQERELLERDRALQRAELERQASLRNMLIIGSVSLVVIVLLLANRYRLKKRSAEILEEKNAALEQANEEIRKHEGMLEQQAAEIERTNRELTRQNALLEQLNSEKNDLMGIVSHDLRNPIGGIRMLAESITEEGRSAEYMRRKAVMVYETADELLVLVRNLLDINRLESGRMQLDSEPVPVAPILVRVREEHARWAERKDIRIHVDRTEDVSALGDDSAIKQILDNLLSNAIKYSPAGSTVHCGITRDADGVRIVVRDHGPGFTEEDRAMLYQKFAKLSARPTGGEYSNGLGLSIVKKLVDTMHGSIRCDSVPGEGSTFTVTLPAG